MEHILKLAVRQSTATIGFVTRTWLCVMAVLWPVISIATAAHGIAPFKGDMPSSFVIGLPVAGLVSIPVMAVLAVIHIARKW